MVRKMHDLPKEIPDVEFMLALQPEELGGKLLFMILRRVQREPNWRPHLGNIQSEPLSNRTDGVTPYPIAKREEVELALAEAWSWLEAQGLLVAAPGPNGANGFRVLS